MRKFKFEIRNLEPTIRHRNKPITVIVSINYELIYNAFFSRPYVTDAEMKAITDWCHETSNGIRSQYNGFSFKDKEQLAMFLLRWS